MKDNEATEPEVNFRNGEKEKVRLQSKDAEQTVHMERQIGLPGAIAMIVGTMVGSGIFITPAGLLKHADSVATSLVVWVVCGLLSTLAALSYVELGTVIPRSGGEQAYLMDAFKPLHPFWGEVPAFMYSWMNMMFLRPVSHAIASLSFGKYTIQPLTKAMGVDADWKDSEEYDFAVKLSAAALICLSGCLNVVSANMATRVHIIFTVGKISAMAIIIGIGVYNVSTGHYGGISMEYDRGNSSYGDIGLAVYVGLFPFDGWNNLNYLVEEVVNPKRNLPLAILIAISSVTLLYLLINLSYLSVLDKDGLIASEAVAVDVGNTVLGQFKFIIPALVAVAAAGSTHGGIFTTGRMGYTASRDGHLPEIVSYVHVTFLTPSVTIILNVILSVAMVWASSTVSQLIGFFTFVIWLFYALALGSLLILRVTKPNVPRPIKLPLIIPVLALTMATVLVLVTIIGQPKVEYLYVLGFALVGLFFYSFLVYKKKTFSWTCKITTVLQCLTMTAPSPYKED